MIRRHTGQRVFPGFEVDHLQRGARIITMKGNEVIENGDIVIKDLQSGSQETVPLQSLVDIIKARIHG